MLLFVLYLPPSPSPPTLIFDNTFDDFEYNFDDDGDDDDDGWMVVVHNVVVVGRIVVPGLGVTVGILLVGLDVGVVVVGIMMLLEG